jgi:hypothetical protein
LCIDYRLNRVCSYFQNIFTLPMWIRLITLRLYWFFFLSLFLLFRAILFTRCCCCHTFLMLHYDNTVKRKKGKESKHFVISFKRVHCKNEWMSGWWKRKKGNESFFPRWKLKREWTKSLKLFLLWGKKLCFCNCFTIKRRMSEGFLKYFFLWATFLLMELFLLNYSNDGQVEFN